MSAAGGAGASASSRKFDPDALLAHFRTCNTHAADVPIEALISGVEQLKTIILTLGSAFSMASSDIDEKLGILRERLADIQKEGAAKGGLAPAAKAPEKGVYAPGTQPRATLQYMVLWEVDRKVEKLNAGKYISGARSLLRLMWFMDFLGVLITHLTEDTKELKEMASDAYDKALGPHHPWLVRKGIQAAMLFCPGKAKFWSTLLAESTVADPARIKGTLVEFLAQMEPVRKGLWDFYRANKLDELP